MKQTAVEWYNLKVIELMTQREQENIDVLEFRNQLDLLLTQAKEMEKQQMKDASCSYVGGWEDDDFEYWYNEKFKKTEK